MIANTIRMSNTKSHAINTMYYMVFIELSTGSVNDRTYD